MENQNTNTKKYLELNGRKFVLVGTAHVSQQSIEEVKSSIEQESPECVAIELDEGRLKTLKDKESWRKTDVVQILKKKMGFLMLANIVLSAYQKRMGVPAGVQPGEEMMAAITKAEELNIPTAMVDRPIVTTLRRAWSKNSFFGKCKLLGILAATAFVKDDVEPEQIEKLKQESEMDSMMNEVSEYLPSVKEVLIDERDKYLASHIWECKGDKVLAVLGAGHLNGVQKHLEAIAASQESSDCSQISEIPPKSKASKVAAWIIPALIVALIASAFVWGGVEAGKKGVASWILWNGLLAGAGAVLALGNPITILVAALSAPITSLCPFMGVGIVAGLVQAMICKPRISDMESLQDDAVGLKGFYRNRILRVLLVFLLTSIGSTIGTFAAGATLVAGITSFFDKIVNSVKSLFN